MSGVECFFIQYWMYSEFAKRRTVLPLFVIGVANPRNAHRSRVLSSLREIRTAPLLARQPDQILHRTSTYSSTGPVWNSNSKSSPLLAISLKFKKRLYNTIRYGLAFAWVSNEICLIDNGPDIDWFWVLIECIGINGQYIDRVLNMIAIDWQSFHSTLDFLLLVVIFMYKNDQRCAILIKYVGDFLVCGPGLECCTKGVEINLVLVLRRNNNSGPFHVYKNDH